MKIDISPLHSQLDKYDIASSWTVVDTPAYFECHYEEDYYFKWPKSWVVVKGLLSRQCTAYEAQLVFKLKKGKTYTYKLPVTLKGKIFEVVYFPSSIEKVYFQPMSSKGSFQLESFEFRSITWFERNYYMLRRVYHLYRNRSQDVIYKAGIRWYQLLFNLSKAYEIAGYFRAYSPKVEYQEWLKLFDRLNQKDIRKIQSSIRKLPQLPSIDVLFLSSGNSPIEGSANKKLASQIYSNFNVVTVDDLRSEYFQKKDSRWLLLVEGNCELRQHSLYWFAYEAFKNSDAVMIYSDHDYIDDNGLRSAPLFKPEWSPELFLSQNFIGGVLMVNTEYLDLESCNNLSIYSIILKLFTLLKPYKSDGFRVGRIPSLLFSMPLEKSGDNLSSLAIKSKQKMLQGFFNSRSISADISLYHDLYNKVVYELKPESLVSIIIPTRDMLEHLEVCVESVLAKTDYLKYEIVIVDNQSIEKETLTYFEKISKLSNVKIISYDKPFNYSAINNFAAEQCNGNVFCLLNNDTEVISPDWLEVMLGQLQQSNVGIVGIKLLFDNGTVQHAGDAVGPGGCADHFFSGYEQDQPGYMGRAILAQDLSAVTAACLLTRRDIFEELGGLDANNLSVAFNDVDYCLRVRERGYRVVFTPYVKMYHHESISRGKDDNPEKMARAQKEADYMRKKWADVMGNDPFYNPNLNYSRPDFELSRFPLVKKPWLSK